MPLTLFDMEGDWGEFQSVGKMSQESSATKPEPLAVSLERLPVIMRPSYLTTASGEKVGWSSEQDGEWRGSLSMPNTLGWPKEDGGFGLLPSLPKLSSVIQQNVPAKYLLSGRACAGILRRSVTRGKTLPPLLEQVLRYQSKEQTEDPKQP